MKLFRSLSAGIAAALILPLAACGSSEEPPAGQSGSGENLGKLTVGLSVPVMAFAPLYWAKDQNTWAKHGLTVEVMEFKAPADGVQAFAGGAVDVSVAGLNGAINLINQGQDVKVFWGGMNAADFAWYGQSKYSSITDAKGATFGVSSHGALDNLVLDAVAVKNGLTPGKDLRYQQVGATANGFAALRAGSLDVTLVSPPTKYQAAAEGFKELATQAEEIAPDWPKEVAYAKSATLTDKKAQLVAFSKGLGDAIAWAKANPEPAASVLAKRFQVDAKFGKAAYDELIPTFFEDGRLPSDAGMDAFWDAMKASKTARVDSEWPLEKWWTEDIRSAVK
jgi:NitT/TauT family transport system substrate-binding protein